MYEKTPILLTLALAFKIRIAKMPFHIRALLPSLRSLHPTALDMAHDIFGLLVKVRLTF